MCKLKSGIILKDSVFVSDCDSHTDMLKELGIEDTRKNAERLFVRAELIPKNDDVFSDINEWTFRVDQDIIPDWFVEEYEKQRMIEAVKEWAKNRIHIDKDNLKIKDGSGHYIKNCKNVQICGSATVENVCDSATVENVCDSATVKYICGNATVEYIYGNATVENIYGNATVENICGNATVKYICGNATVKNVYDSATVENVCDSATVKYIYGNATVKNVYDSATVENVCGNATVENICGSATVENICGSATVKNVYDSATVEKSKGRAVIITSPNIKWKNQDKLLLLENSTLKDNYGKVIYQSGDMKLVAVTDGKIEMVGEGK